MPYNIHYQIHNKNNSNTLNSESDTETETHFDTLSTNFLDKFNQKINLSEINKKETINNEKTTLNYISPDEGVYSSSSDSSSNTDNLIDTTNFYNNFTKNNLNINKNNSNGQNFDNFVLNTGELVQQKQNSLDKLNGINRRKTILSESKYSINSLPPVYATITNYAKTNNANNICNTNQFCKTNQNDIKKSNFFCNSNITVFPTTFISDINSSNVSLNKVLNNVVKIKNSNNSVNKNTIKNFKIANDNSYDDSILASTSILAQKPYLVSKNNYTNNNLSVQSFNGCNNINNTKSYRSLSVEPNASLKINLNNNKILLTNDISFADVGPIYNKNNNSSNNRSENLINLFQHLKKEIVS